MKDLGNYLKELRNQLNYSLKDVYDHCGITDSKLSRMERGEGKLLEPCELKKLAELYNVSVVPLYLKAGYLSENDLKNYQLIFENADLLNENELKSLQMQINLLTKDRRCSSKEFRLGELFCGPGGLAWGATHADIGKGYHIKHVWANDYDADTCKTYIRNICPDNPESVYNADVRKIDLTAFPEIDAFAFGFPCNDFSVVGQQKGIDGTYGPLYTYGIKVLKQYHPKWFLAENVGGLKTANDGQAFTMILDAMRKAGYKLYPNLYKFEDYGIPQARHRIIIVGIRDDLDFEFKIPSSEEYINEDNSCRTAIECPPIPVDAANNERTIQSPQVVERLKYIKPGQNAFTAQLPEELMLHVKGAKISQIYKRLDPAKPAYTVTGSGGGGTHIYHWSEPRALTNRERARLQTFPDDFIFEGSKESVRKQIGMAVPCKAAKIIFEAILKTFAGVSYPYMEANINE